MSWLAILDVFKEGDVQAGELVSSGGCAFWDEDCKDRLADYQDLEASKLDMLLDQANRPKESMDKLWFIIGGTIAISIILVMLMLYFKNKNKQ